MWRPATRQITGTNDGEFALISVSQVFRKLTVSTVPLGQRRRFGPAPIEDSAPAQIDQPSPSAYPRQHDNESLRKTAVEKSHP
ncbi:hypothetical protein MPER_01958 [Moniliophthora perniciosa FA553]|nr:hypothetical protein MPER_01958 [Moniliophthora perniciosa FA553]